MKRFLAPVLSLIFLLSLAACGREGKAPASQPESSPSSVSEPAPASASSEPPSGGSEQEGPAALEGSSQPSQGENAPNTSLVETEEQEAVDQRAHELFSDLNDLFSLSKESYSYFTCYADGASVVLEIGVTDEAAVDAFLVDWTGTKWDTLLKIPSSASQSRQEEFAKRAEQLAVGPNTDIHITARDGPAYAENGRILISATVTDGKPWEDIPQEIRELAEEMGIPEYMLYYICRSDDGIVTNTIP